MICTRTYTATLRTPAGTTYPLTVLDGSLSLSEARAPYALASLTIAHPGLSVLAALDPTAAPRVTVTATSTPGASRTFDLFLSARQVETEGARVGLNLSGDELLLTDYLRTLTTPDVSFWGNQNSVRSIVYNVLNRVFGPGFSLVYQTIDRAVPTYSAVQNLATVGSFEIPSGVWLLSNVTPAQSSEWAKYGTYSLRLTTTGTSEDTYAYLPSPGLQAGKTYTASGWYRQATAQSVTRPRARSIVATAVVGGRERIIATSSSAPNIIHSTPTAAGSRVALTFTVPANATDATIRLYDGYTGHVCWWDGILLVEGNGMETNNITPLVYFDGDTLDSDTYVYDWDDAVGLSSSRRTPVLERTPDFLTWSPGQSAWDFLTPILQAVGLRLFCDEGRVWRLADDTYSVPGVVRAAAGLNLYSHTDLMSRTATQTDGLPLFCDAVVIEYRWTDARGVEQVRYDQAGSASPSKAYYLERRETAYPGPGTAAYILRRLQARQKQQTATAAIDFAATPGMTVAITSSATEALTGYLDSVEWGLSSDDMQLVSKGLVLVASGSIGRAPANQTVGSITSTIADYTN